MTVQREFVTKSINSEELSLLDRDKLLTILKEANTKDMALVEISDLDQSINIWGILDAEIMYQERGEYFATSFFPQTKDDLLDHLVILATGLILDHVSSKPETLDFDVKDVWPDPKNTCEVTLNAPSVLGLARDIQLGLVKDTSITFTKEEDQK